MKTTGSPQELASLYKRMAQAMAQLKRLPKRGQNKHFNYMYVTDSDVLDAVRGALGGVGIAFFNDLVDMEQDGNRTLITLDATFADGETGASVTVTWAGEALDSQDKGINKALTGAVKYGLLKTLLVSTGEDDPDDEQPDDKGDGQKSKPAAKPQQKVKSAQPSPGPADESNDKPTLHWIDDPKVRPRFWKWARDERGLDDEQVHQALNVKSVKDFPGTMDQAKTLIEAWPTEEAPNAG